MSWKLAAAKATSIILLDAFRNNTPPRRLKGEGEGEGVEEKFDEGKGWRSGGNATNYRPYHPRTLFYLQ